ncbi:hypothetical protein FD38_GL001342 [Levilactobacillus zymae DSM 19395]|nr:hypothetical protein FD38_GL001342 [Levilactobacillus zymae DSM 19395]
MIMKNLETIMPMNLQYFAEDDIQNNGDQANDEIDHTGDESNTNNSNGNDDSSSSDDEKPNSDDNSNDAVIKKLKGRIGKEQSRKNELQAQLDQAQAELEKLRGGDKNKEKPKSPEQQEIAALKAQMARRDTVDETLSVFTESGIDVPKNIVEVLVTDDHDKTIDNASKLLDFITNVRKTTEDAVRKEYQAGHIPNATKHGNESLTDFGKSIAESNNSRASLDNFK